MNERTHDRDPAGDHDGKRDGDGDRDDGRLSLGQIVGSTLAAAFGVQSSRNRERDFTRGKALQFIIAGVVFTALFVGLLVLIVSLVT